MRTLVYLTLLVSLCLTVGCQSASRRSEGGSASGGSRNTDNPFPTGGGSKNANAGTPKLASSDANQVDVSGVLAGQIIDRYNRHPGRAYIQVTKTAEVTSKNGKASTDVQADENGCFVIYGLQPGQSYTLVARWKDGEQMLAGTVETSPPNSRLVIKISEDLVAPSTPAIPPPPKLPGKEPVPVPTPAPAPSKQGDDPLLGPSSGAAKNPEPTPASVPQPPTRAPSIRPDSITLTTPKTMPDRTPVPTSIPNRPAPKEPFCDPIQGGRVSNFGLKDTVGDMWEWKNNTAKLVLLDFWATNCGPCIKSMPQLVELQRRYGPDLQVIGIAYCPMNRQDRVAAVEGISQRARVNYRMLMSEGSSCPVAQGFGVQAYPTLVLLRHDGRIVWRHTGADKLGELETLIQRENPR